MCVCARGGVFRENSKEQIAKIRLYVSFPCLFAVYMCDQDPGAFRNTALPFLTPTVLSYSGEDTVQHQ